MKTNKNFAGIFLLSAILGCVMTGVFWEKSLGETPNSLSRLVEEAQLIFYGTVLELEQSPDVKFGESHASFPATYVTFRIEEALKGNSADPEILTLRFLGGESKDGRILEASHIPSFKKDEEYVLFVKNDSQSDCPLVDCRFGQFPVLHGRVYGNGQGSITDMLKQTPTMNTCWDELNDPQSLDCFQSVIVEEVQRLHSREDLLGLEPVKSDNPGEITHLPELEESPPPVPPVMPLP